MNKEDVYSTKQTTDYNQQKKDEDYIFYSLEDVDRISWDETIAKEVSRVYLDFVHSNPIGEIMEDSELQKRVFCRAASLNLIIRELTLKQDNPQIKAALETLKQAQNDLDLTLKPLRKGLDYITLYRTMTACDCDALTASDLIHNAIFYSKSDEADGSEAMVSIGVVASDITSYVRASSKRKNDTYIMPTGISELDRALNGGLHPDELYIIAGRQGVGKTSFALDIALNSLKSTGRTVAYFSLGRTKEQLAEEIIWREAKIDLDKGWYSSLNKEETERIAEAGTKMNDLPLLFCDKPDITIPFIQHRCREIENLGLIVIDYLQLLPPIGSAADKPVYYIFPILRMANWLHVPVLLLSRSPRKSKDSVHGMAQLDDLKNLGELTPYANAVIGLYKEQVKDSTGKESTCTEAIVVKNKHEATGLINLVL